ncbi:MAG: WYL domain-containing protein [Eubacteriaceae bacterium]|nr:WYL domain-containing protein [Eubacteriaceae bacterium]
MIFSELYSAYYNAVAAILREAVRRSLSMDDIRAIARRSAFGESLLNIEPAITEERWQLIRPDGTTPLRHAPTMPLTTLEKRWLKSVYMDPRVRLFTDDNVDFPDVEPLFGEDDYSVFDRYSDGDPYTDENYIRNFRIILDAARNRYPLEVRMRNRRGRISSFLLVPEYLEYSEKDDKFRLVGHRKNHRGTINIARITECALSKKEVEVTAQEDHASFRRTLEFSLTDERNALERVLMHFAHFRKEVERTGERTYKVTVEYERFDETEMVIRVLSFGPMIKVTSPKRFVELIKERLSEQKSCGL